MCQSPDVRMVASLLHLSWLAVAVKRETRLLDLQRAADYPFPLGVAIRGAWESEAALPARAVLEHVGLTPDVLAQRGGALLDVNERHRFWFREDMVDLYIDRVFHGYTPATRHWFDFTLLCNVRFLGLPDALRTRLHDHLGFAPCDLPARFLRGVDGPVPAVASEGIVVFAHASVSEDVAYAVASALEQAGDAVYETAINLAYDERSVWRSSVPLHPGAERYYRERGRLA